MKNLMILATFLCVLTGCATTQTITPNYVSPNNYQDKSCQALSHEIARIEQLSTATQNKQASLSASGIGIGIGIAGGLHGIYPTISFGVGTQNADKKITLAKLYGEHDAMVMAGRAKNCGFTHKIYGE